MKSVTQRLNNITGQIEGVKKMVVEEKDCVDVLTQLKAIRSAISGVMDFIVEDQISSCMKSLKNNDKKLLAKLKNYVKGN